MSEDIELSWLFQHDLKKVMGSVVILNVIDIIIILKREIILVVWLYHKKDTEQHKPIISDCGIQLFSSAITKHV